jgi:hypothetical protein
LLTQCLFSGQTGLFPLVEQASAGVGGQPGPAFVRGIKARGDIADGDILFAVPPSLLINIALVRHDASLGAVYHNMSAMRDGVSGLAVWLLREALNKSSEWRPYLCSLPKVTRTQTRHKVREATSSHPARMQCVCRQFQKRPVTLALVHSTCA